MRRTFNISKHSYIKGQKAVGRALAHVRYIQYRDGEDKDRASPARPFFDRERDEVMGFEVRQQIQDWDGRGVAMHKIVLSPAINGVDLKEYTREVMDELSREKGQQLDWKAVVHENTDHHHIHLCVMGKDLENHEVRFYLKDLRALEAAGNRYLEREHYYDRFLDRELHDITSREGYDRRGDRFFKELFYNPDKFREVEEERKRDAERLIPKEQWDRDEAVRNLPGNEKIYANDNVYSKFSTREELFELNSYLKETELWIKPDLYDKMWTWIGVKNRAGDDFYEKEDRGVKDYQDYEDFKRFEEDMRRALSSESGEIPRSVRGDQRILEQQGRLSDYHYIYSRDMQRQRLEEIAEHQPENSDWAKREIEELKQFKNEYWQSRNINIDKILYGCEEPWYPWEKKAERDGGQHGSDQTDSEIEQPITEIPLLKGDDSDSPAREHDDKSEETDPLSIRIDLLGGRTQLDDEDRERDIDRDFFGNES